SSPRLLAAMVEEAVSVGERVEILRFEGGLARLVEVTLADDAAVVGRSIASIALPREATIVAVLRGDHLVVPRGETVFEPGDEVLVLVTPDSEDQIREILTGTASPPGTV
ncbi:MAG: TrkA C-terminal domain-containing protein, partial [Acidimicrobiia bacterium]